MLHVIDSVLNPEELKAVHDEAAKLKFADGALTAQGTAKTVKNNQQALDFQKSSAHMLIQRSIRRNDQFNLIAAPLRISDLMLSSYQTGMEYGWHMDNPLMHSGALRTDLAFTLFLDEPNTYEGGELEIECEGNNQAYKLCAGSMIVYPACHLHRVTPVRTGRRLAIVGWVQSVVRDPRHRQILYDIATVRKSMLSKQGNSTEFENLGKTLSGLLRLWAEN